MSLASREHNQTKAHQPRCSAQPQSHYLIRDDSLKVTESHVFFANLNLDTKAIDAMLRPFMELVGQRISFTYKSPAKITFQGISGIFHLELSDWLQFDDVCIKFLHVATGANVLVSLSTQFARTLLIRLLSTPLVDDSHGVLFSTTERGILAFIIARLMLDLKHRLGESMPDLKLIGIYHSQDESLHETAIADYGVFNFSFAFAHDSFPVSIALPMTMFNSIRPPQAKLDMVGRCGHIKRSMSFIVTTLIMTQASLASLAFGDLIVFDRASLQVKKCQLEGTLHGLWDGIAIKGRLVHDEGHYLFSPVSVDGFSRIEDATMENVEILESTQARTADAETNEKTRLADLAKNIRVSLSIELARLPLTLKEVCQIREGEIIDLHRKIDDPLDMVVEGKVIGQCQPVQIDGRLGIRVVSIDGDTTTI